MKKPRYVAHINNIYYWRPSKPMRNAGLSIERLGTNLDAKAIDRAEWLNAQWDEIYAANKLNEAIDPQRGDFNWLVDKFQKDPTWYMSRSQPTRDEMDYVFKILAVEFGEFPARIIASRHCRAYYNKLRTEHGASVHKTRKIFKWFTRLMRYAKNIGVRDDVPTADMEMETPKGRSQVWLEGEVMAVVNHALKGGKADSGNIVHPRPSIAYATLIAYDTSLPQQDILALTWAQWDGQGFSVLQKKKRGARDFQKEIYTPVNEKTAAMVNALRDGLGVTPLPSRRIIISEDTGRAYDSRNVFSRIFRKFKNRAGVRKELKFQDLRRTALTEMGNRGATHTEITSFSGHDVGSRVLNTYVKPNKEAAIRAARKRWGGKLSN